MARITRAEVFDPREVSVFHCLNRCVRRAFLCGRDAVSGRDYEHRKAWLEMRLRFLASCFGIDLLTFAIMSNHFHVILRNRPDIVEGWSDLEIARRWLRLCPLHKAENNEWPEPTERELAFACGNSDLLAKYRRRLSDISWFMRFAAEEVARRANAEDGCTGRFWEGRFKAVKLCDDAAILACCVYVDLNPVRAGCATTPETSEHTGARLRIDTSADCLATLPLDERSTAGPMPSPLSTRASDKGFLRMPLDDYLDLLDWTGRQASPGKRGIIPAELASILERVAIPTEAWVELSLGFGKLFHRVAGTTTSVARESARARRRFRAPGARLIAASRVRSG